MDPSSPIEKHFVLPPILYAGCQQIHILLSILPLCTRTDTASKGVARKVESFELKYGTVASTAPNCSLKSKIIIIIIIIIT